MTEKPLNILEEPIENLQFRDDSKWALVGIYPDYRQNDVIVLSKQVDGACYRAGQYTSNGEWILSRESGCDVISKKRIVADWLLFSHTQDTIAIWRRLNGVEGEPVCIPSRKVKIPDTEREV